MNTIRIGIFGLNYESNNFGCAALSYSFLNIITGIIVRTEKKFTFTYYDSVKSSLTKPLDIVHPQIRFEIFRYDKHNIKALHQKLKEEDLVFDFTAGDSFTDYYGFDRFIKRTFIKTLVIKNKTKLILGPQTYGPYRRLLSKIWAGYVIRHAYRVYARDGASKKRAIEVSHKNNVKRVTDVAFALDYDVERYRDFVSHDKLNIGINFSGLLYSGGYTKDNQFGLTVDYKEYCHKLLEYFSEYSEKYHIWLIPHVVSETVGFADNDLLPIEALKDRYSFVKTAPVFQSPSDAKSFISQMDIFTGARMHATIAAFSSNVVTIPFSYSVKFEGLYGELNYKYCVHGKKDSTQAAVNKTIEFIENYTELRDAQKKSLALAEKKISLFEHDIEEVITNL